MDDVGRRLRRRKAVVGIQGRQTEWLYSEAALDKPDASLLAANATGLLTRPGLRALQAVVRKEALETNVDLPKALARLKEESTSALAKAFLEGNMGRAIRIHWRSRYRGPSSLFPFWFYLVAYIRYGKRHLYLDTLAAILQEFRE